VSAAISFLLASSLHHPFMNFCHISLLLLVVLSAYSGSPHAKPPDSPKPIKVTNSSAHLGILAPVLPLNEVLKIVQPQNGVYRAVQPPNEVLKSVAANCQLSCNLKIIMDFVLVFCYMVQKN